MFLMNIRKLSKTWCCEFKDIFSVDSGDIGKTPLVEMEIDTGDSSPNHTETLYPSFEAC